MMQTIDGVCLRLTVGRQVARCTLRKRSRLNTTIDGERGEDLGIAIELRRRDDDQRLGPADRMAANAAG